jgi:DNA-binding MarR family transcriptional regulator
VQRIADLLVDKGLAEYVPNPAHSRAKLLQPTPAGREANDRIGPGHRKLAERFVDELGMAEFERAVAALERLSEALKRIDPD